MNIKNQSSNTGDVWKWAIIWLLLLTAVAGNYYYANQPFTYRLIADIIWGLIVLAFCLQTVKGRTFVLFLNNAKLELRKVVWPTKQEVTQMAFIVLVAVIIVGLILWLMDSFYLWAVRLITQG